MTPKDDHELEAPPAPDVAAAASAAGDAGPDKPRKQRPTTRAVRAAAGEGKQRGPGRPPKPKLGERLGAMVAGIGMGVAAFNVPDGKAIIEGADELGMALEKWADESPAVRKVLENFLEASAAGLVLVALAKIAIPVAANHGALPPAAAGAVAALAGNVPDYPPGENDGQAA